MNWTTNLGDKRLAGRPAGGMGGRATAISRTTGQPHVHGAGTSAEDQVRLIPVSTHTLQQGLGYPYCDTCVHRFPLPNNKCRAAQIQGPQGHR